MNDQELAAIEARQKAATPEGRVIFESDIIEKDVPKLIAALREALESDTESLKLYRAARDRAETANLQLSDLKKAVKELLALKECGTFKEAEIRERVKYLLADVVEGVSRKRAEEIMALWMDGGRVPAERNET